MTVGVVKIDAATAVQMVDLTGLGAPRIGVIADALGADAGERRVELGVADKEGGSRPSSATMTAGGVMLFAMKKLHRSLR
jgi:hypothetical protein